MLATGYIHQNPPDCEAALDQVNMLERETIATSPDLVLKIANHCDTDLLGRIKASLPEAHDPALWANHLANAGFTGEAYRQLQNLIGRQAVDVIVALAENSHWVEESEVSQALNCLLYTSPSPRD